MESISNPKGQETVQKKPKGQESAKKGTRYGILRDMRDRVQRDTRCGTLRDTRDRVQRDTREPSDLIALSKTSNINLIL